MTGGASGADGARPAGALVRAPRGPGAVLREGVRIGCGGGGVQTRA
ncbi:hypothetical protein STRIP9103_00664 [Streptomyces ipomoeae 91-03]|uniref:Uncharacterized protein n=1 Tax=Streptomyces ipomoeae 91-03 TaxID=698759 RepID=L1KLJ6_9ACTN|nr:hypothetical protein STRIP9103_00664 [Streptomyces ipomoeae 91-03]